MGILRRLGCTLLREKKFERRHSLFPISHSLGTNAAWGKVCAMAGDPIGADSQLLPPSPQVLP